MKRFSILLAGTALCALPIAANAACMSSDVTLVISGPLGDTYAPSVCGPAVSAANNPASELLVMGPALGEMGLVYLGKSGASLAPPFGGIQFAVTATNVVNGIWGVTWTDANGPLAQNLPVQIDFAVLLTGGNNGVAYLFDNVVLPDVPNNSGAGTFKITFLNGSGKNNPDLSHLTLAGANFVPVTPPDDDPPGDDGDPPPKAVPEPISLALLGTGILGLAAVRRRRS